MCKKKIKNKITNQPTSLPCQKSSFSSSGFFHDSSRPFLLQLPSHNLPAAHFILTLAHLFLEHQQLVSAKVWNWHPPLLPRTPVAPVPPYPPIHPVSYFPLNSQPSDLVFICSLSWRLVNAKPCARWLLSSAFFVVCLVFFPQTGSQGDRLG